MRSQEVSAQTGKPYPMRLVLSVASLSSAAWYGKRPVKTSKQRPGPKPLISDEALLEAIRQDLSQSRFHSEGHKKVHARLRRNGIRVGRKRMLRVMKANNLLAPVRPKSNGSSRPHDGTIITPALNQMWGTDGKQFWTQEEGMCWFFGVIDHCNDEILGWHAAKIGNRFAAMEPVRQAIKGQYGAVDRHIVKGIGLALRKDHGSQYDSHDFVREMKYFGLELSPAFVRSPECNGIIERFHRTLQEQVFDIHVFKNLEEARWAIAKFIEDYNTYWLLERHGHRSPLEVRADFKQALLNAA